MTARSLDDASLRPLVGPPTRRAADPAPELVYLGTPLCRDCSLEMRVDAGERTLRCPRGHAGERYTLSDEGAPYGVVITRWRRRQA